MTAALSTLRRRAGFGLALLCLLFLAAAGAPPAPASTLLWDDDGNLILGGPSDDWPGMIARHAVGTTVCTDGDGGLIGAGVTAPWGATMFELRIQRLNSYGNEMWSAGTGIALTGGLVSGSGPPHVVSDVAGGAWVAWADDRSVTPGIYIQRVFGNGVFAFAGSPTGVRISNGDADSQGDDDVDVEVTPTGKLLVAYWDAGLRLQRVTLAGALELGVGGLLVTSDAGHGRLDLVADGEGALVVWESQRAGQSGATSIFANRVDAGGARLWGTEGVQVFSASGVVPEVTHAAWDGTSLFVSWEQNRSAWFDVHAQRLDGTGSRQWGGATTGLTVLAAPNTAWDRTGGDSRPLPQLVADGAGGCIVAWQDYRDYDRGTSPYFHREDLYGQRLSVAGVAQWSANGAPLDTLLGRQIDVQMISDGSNGAILAFADYVDVDFDITAKRVDGTGTSLWRNFLTGGLDNGGQYDPVVAHDDAGGLLCSWRDSGGSSNACMGTHRMGSGLKYVAGITVTAPNGSERLLAGQSFDVTWTTSMGGDVKIEYSKGGGVHQNIAASTPNDGAHSWTVPNDPSDQVKIHVSDALDGQPADSSDAYFTICAGLAASATSYGSVGSMPYDVAVADMNRDDILDLLVCHIAGSTSRLYVRRGDGTGGVGDGTFSAGGQYVVGAPAMAIAAGDFNEDGYVDVAVATATDVRVMLGTAAGGLGAAVSFAAGGQFTDVLTADFNEDGIADLAATNTSSNNVAVLLGRGSGGVGDGTFLAAMTFGTATSPVHLAVGDFNEDGRLDLAITNNSSVSNSVSILLGNGVGPVGNGTFPTPVHYPAGSNPYGIATGDFDEDGITDLAVTNSGSDDVSILLGNGSGGVGDGTFAPQVRYAAGNMPRGVVVGDSDGDGIADLLIAAKSSDAVALLRGGGADAAGDGTFGEPVFYPVGDGPEALVASDFNEDGAIDVAEVNSSGNNLWVRLGSDCGLGLPASVSMVTPDGGEGWRVGDEQTFVWSRGEGVMAVNVDVSRDGGLTWESVATNLTGTSWTWTATGPPTTSALARVFDPTAPQRRDSSDATFVIFPAGVGVPPGAAPRAAFAPGWPNPFSDRVRFTVAVPRPARVGVRVYDLAGRCVRALLDGELGAGEHAVTWDGRDTSGGEVGAGVYFVRACWADFAAVRRVVRIR